MQQDELRTQIPLFSWLQIQELQRALLHPLEGRPPWSHASTCRKVWPFLEQRMNDWYRKEVCLRHLLATFDYISEAVLSAVRTDRAGCFDREKNAVACTLLLLMHTLLAQ